MTIYARPEMFIDTTPTFAQNIAGSLGTLAGRGLSNYLQNKQLRELQQLSQQNTRAQQDFLAQKLEEIGIPGQAAYLPKNLQDLYLKQYFDQQYISNLENEFGDQNLPQPTLNNPENIQNPPKRTLPGLPGLVLSDETTSPPLPPPPSPSTPDKEMQSNINGKRYTPKQLQQLALRDPKRATAIRQQYEAEDQQALNSRKADQKDRDYALQTNKNYIEKISAKRNNLSRKQGAITLLGEANTSGRLGFNIRNFLAERYGMEYLLDPNAPLYNAATKTLLVGDRGNIGRSNQFLDKIMRDALGTYRDSQKARYIFQAGLQGTANKEREEIRVYDQLSKEDREKYGYIQPDIEDRVNEILGKFYDEEDARTVEKINEIKRGYGFYYSRDFSNPEAYLNAPRGTPLTQEAMDYFLERNNNNWLAAERDAYANGYRGATRRGRIQ